MRRLGGAKSFSFQMEPGKSAGRKGRRATATPQKKTEARTERTSISQPPTFVSGRESVPAKEAVPQKIPRFSASTYSGFLERPETGKAAKRTPHKGHIYIYILHIDIALGWGLFVLFT